MMSLAVFMLLSVGLFGVMGLLRGGHKEFLATIGIVLAVFVLTLMERYIPSLHNMDPASKTLFAIRVLVFGLIVFFGYQTPRRSGVNQAGGTAKDALLGLLFGLLNGYLVMGMLWHFLDAAQYPWPDLISPPSTSDALAQRMLKILPHVFMGVPGIYIAVAVLFVIMIVVFV